MKGSGSVELRCVNRGGRDVVDVLRASGLSRAHRPLHHEAAPHVVLALLGPGMIGGDRFALDVTVEAGAALMVGGQMATPVFAGDGAAALAATLRVGAGGMVYSIGEPLLVDQRAALETFTSVDVERDGVAVVAETIVLARDAALRSVVSATYAGTPALRDVASIQPGDRREHAVASIYRIGTWGRAEAGEAAWRLIDDAPGDVRGGVGATASALVARLVGDPDRIRRCAEAIARRWFDPADRAGYAVGAARPANSDVLVVTKPKH